MSSRMRAFFSATARRSWPVTVSSCSFWFLLVCATAALADDFGIFQPHPRFDLLANTILIAYGPMVWLLESVVFKVFLKLRYRACLGLSFYANTASTIVSWTWYLGGGGTGWKTAWVYGNWDQFALLFTRSFLVTLAVESVVVILILARRLDAVRTFLAVVAANAVTYALTAIYVASMVRTLPAGGR